MPIFEYYCEECHTVFERLTLRLQAVTEITCAHCGSSRTTKVFSTFSTNAGQGVSVGQTEGRGFS